MNSCINKYTTALKHFVGEKNLFLANIADLHLRGENEYDVRDI
jgi:hypothetical protein